MREITARAYRECINIALKNKDGVAYFKLGKTSKGQTIALVIGWEVGYEWGERYQIKDFSGTIYTLVGKIAVNTDDLQCDYDWDWMMPWNKDNDIYDTNVAIDDTVTQLEWFQDEAEIIEKMLKDGVLFV